MTGFDLTNKAKSDLKDIAIYTQNTWGKRQRNIYLTMLDKSFYALAADHSMGLDCSEIRKGYRKHKADNPAVTAPTRLCFDDGSQSRQIHVSEI